MSHTRVTLDTVAEHLGVSRMSVSNAYNHPERLGPELRARILEVAERLGYPGPDPRGSVLRRGTTGALGFISDDTLTRALTDPAAAQMLQGIAEECERAGRGLVLIPWSDAVERAAALVNAALVDSFIFYSDFVDDPRLGAVRRRRLPYVLIDSPRLEQASWVGIDDRAAAATQAEHLVALGHRRLGILTLPLAPGGRSGPATPDRVAAGGFHVTRERLAGYGRALATVGIELSDVPTWECPVSDVEAGRRGATALLERDERPTAILAMSDQLALGALGAAAARHLDVPADLSIVGFDDIPEAERSFPALTTIRQPSRRKGAVAAALLLRERADALEIVKLPTRLVVRASTAVPAR